MFNFLNLTHITQVSLTPKFYGVQTKVRLCLPTTATLPLQGTLSLQRQMQSKQH